MRSVDHYEIHTEPRPTIAVRPSHRFPERRPYLPGRSAPPDRRLLPSTVLFFLIVLFAMVLQPGRFQFEMGEEAGRIVTEKALALSLMAPPLEPIPRAELPPPPRFESNPLPPPAAPREPLTRPKTVLVEPVPPAVAAAKPWYGIGRITGHGGEQCETTIPYAEPPAQVKLALAPASAPKTPIPVPPSPAPYRIHLSETPVLQRVGEPLVVVARVTTQSGAPATNAEVHWRLHQQSVGVIAAAQEPPFDDEKEARTAAAARSVTLRQPGCFEGLPPWIAASDLAPGECWCVVNSPTAGDMILTVHVPGIDAPERQTLSRRIYWTNAAAEFPTTTKALSGEAVRLTTTVRDAATRLPLSGYRIRYRLEPASDAAFTGGRPRLEMETDSAGQAIAELKRLGWDAANSLVRTELLGVPTISGLPPVVLDTAETKVEWLAPSVALEMAAPAFAAVGTRVDVTLAVTNRSELALSGLRLRLGSSAVATTASRVPLGDDLGTIAAGKSVRRTIELACRDEAEVWLHGAAEMNGQVLATAQAKVVFERPRLTIQKAEGSPWHVGTPRDVALSVVNESRVPAHAVVVREELLPGMALVATNGIPRVGAVMWRAEILEPGDRLECHYRALPSRVCERVAVATSATSREGRRAEIHSITEVIGVPALQVAIADGADPIPAGGSTEYTVTITNRGTAPASRVVLKAEVDAAKISVARSGLALSQRQNRLESEPFDLPPGGRRIVRLQAGGWTKGEARLSVRLDHASLGPNGLVTQESTAVYPPATEIQPAVATGP